MALALAVAAGSSERVHSEFANIIGELVSAWPSTVTLFKLTALRLCEELAISQSKHYWPSLIRLRAASASAGTCVNRMKSSSPVCDTIMMRSRWPCSRE